ncbi:MAG: Rieske (2Fe-2S) protein [bacterium]
MPKSLHLCKLSDIADGESREFKLGDQSIVVIRRADGIFAYRNVCPHLGVPLNWMPDQFLDMDKEFIICSTHGALFEIPTGHCISGPCAGDRLQSLPISIRDEAVFIQHEAP